MINMTKEEEDKAKGDKTHGDERIQQIKGESKRNIKNDRHNFTVDLRKKKRDDMIKKRRHIGQNTNGTDATEGANANSNVNLGSLDPTTMTI